MEHHEISTLLSHSTVSKFVTRKWIEVIDLSDLPGNKNIRLKTPMLRSSFVTLVMYILS